MRISAPWQISPSMIVFSLWSRLTIKALTCKRLLLQFPHSLGLRNLCDIDIIPNIIYHYKYLQINNTKMKLAVSVAVFIASVNAFTPVSTTGITSSSFIPPDANKFLAHSMLPIISNTWMHWCKCWIKGPSCLLKCVSNRLIFLVNYILTQQRWYFLTDRLAAWGKPLANETKT